MRQSKRILDRGAIRGFREVNTHVEVVFETAELLRHQQLHDQHQQWHKPSDEGTNHHLQCFCAIGIHRRCLWNKLQSRTRKVTLEYA